MKHLHAGGTATSPHHQAPNEAEYPSPVGHIYENLSQRSNGEL